MVSNPATCRPIGATWKEKCRSLTVLLCNTHICGVLQAKLDAEKLKMSALVLKIFLLVPWDDDMVFSL